MADKVRYSCGRPLWTTKLELKEVASERSDETDSCDCHRGKFRSLIVVFPENWTFLFSSAGTLNGSEKLYTKAHEIQSAGSYAAD
jgi:hypothetical protein